MSETTTIDDATRLRQLEAEFERSRVRRDGWTLLIFAFAAVAVLVSVFGIGFGLRAIDESRLSAGGEVVDVVDVELSDFAIDLSSDAVATGGELRIRNTGAMVHNVAVRRTDLTSPDLGAGESGTLDLGDLPAGTYELFCTIPGHAEAGMTARLTVGEPGRDGAAAGHHGGHDLTAEAGAAQDRAMIDSILAFPAETRGRGNQPLVPEILLHSRHDPRGTRGALHRAVPRVGARHLGVALPHPEPRRVRRRHVRHGHRRHREVRRRCRPPLRPR